MHKYFILCLTLTLLTTLFISPAAHAKSSLTPESLITATNIERIKHNLSPLVVDDRLSTVAQKRANEMAFYNYFSHTTSTGKPFWYRVQDTGYSFATTGENLATDFTDATSTVVAWMNSPTHRGNILKAEYEDIGIAVARKPIEHGGGYYIVQIFGTLLAN